MKAKVCKGAFLMETVFRFLKVASMVCRPCSPGLDGQLRVQHTGRNPKLLQKQFESVASVHRAHKQQRLALNQLQPQQRVDEQELVLLLTLDAVLLQLAAVRQLRALKLQDHLRGHRCRYEDQTRPNNTRTTFLRL